MKAGEAARLDQPVRCTVVVHALVTGIETETIDVSTMGGDQQRVPVRQLVTLELSDGTVVRVAPDHELHEVRT